MRPNKGWPRRKPSKGALRKNPESSSNREPKFTQRPEAQRFLVGFVAPALAGAIPLGGASGASASVDTNGTSDQPVRVAALGHIGRLRGADPADPSCGGPIGQYGQTFTDWRFATVNRASPQCLRCPMTEFSHYHNPDDHDTGDPQRGFLAHQRSRERCRVGRAGSRALARRGLGTWV